ncbi:MAG: uroporphyrinogen decarboxylase family protein [Promethearchaeota archaeon]
MPYDTCKTEQLILKALRNEEELEGRIPSFVQSVLPKIASEFFERFDTDEHPLEDDQILLTDVGDYTIFKALGYDSHWCGSPAPKLIADDELVEYVRKVEAELRKTHPRYKVDYLGKIRSGNEITNWYVGPIIKDEETLRFFLDHLEYKPPDDKEIEKWRRSRKQSFEKEFCQFISSNIVMEAGLGASFALISKLMRKNPSLLEEWYDFLATEAELRFKAGVKAGFKLFCTADDMAYKTGPMMSPANYDRFVIPRSKRLCDIVRDAGGVIFMHTDGNIYEVIDLFIKAGYHGIQPLEPTSGMSIKKVKEKWGDKIACIGNVDTTKLLPFGTEEETRAAVHRVMREGGKKGYMFAASGTLHNRVKLDNVLAMLDEWKKINEGIVPL